MMKVNDFNFNYRLLDIHRTNEKAKLKQQEVIYKSKRINHVSDDTSGFSTSQSLIAKSALNVSYLNNLNSASRVLDTAQTNLELQESLIVKMQSLATGTINPTITDRANVQKMVESYCSEIQYIGNSAAYNNKKLLTGDLKDDFAAGESSNINLDLNKSNATSLGATTNGTKAIRTVNFDGYNLSKVINTADNTTVSTSSIADQRITIKNAAETKYVTISAALENTAIDKVVKSIKELNMDGIREADTISQIALSLDPADLQRTEGDLIDYAIKVGGDSVRVKFLVGQNFAATNSNFTSALATAVTDLNNTIGYADLKYGNNTLISSTGKNVWVGDVKTTDNPGIKLGGFENTSPAGSQITFDLDGQSISFVL